VRIKEGGIIGKLWRQCCSLLREKKGVRDEERVVSVGRACQRCTRR
jgi:hypothetical protein